MCYHLSRDPGLDGFEVCRQLRSNPETAFTAIVMLTARGAERDIMKLLHPHGVFTLRVNGTPANPDALKIVYCIAMLAGRLEIYTLMILVGQSLSRPK